MKCVFKETEEFECFHLTIYNINEFIKWLNKNSKDQYEFIEIYEDYIHTYCNNMTIDFYVNKWYVLKNGNLYDYDEDVFNQIYRRI